MSKIVVKAEHQLKMLGKGKLPPLLTIVHAEGKCGYAEAMNHPGKGWRWSMCTLEAGHAGHKGKEK